MMRRVILESPYAGDVAANTVYARQCLKDCLDRGEAPLASHLLYTLPGVLDDRVPADRALGISAGLAWLEQADAMVVYTDRGMSPGMQSAMEWATLAGIPVEFRALAPVLVTDPEAF